MARVVYVPELGRSFSFAEGTSDQAVSSFFQSNFPAPPPVAGPVAPAPPPGPDESGLFGSFAYDFATGLTNVPGGIASLMYPAEDASQTAGGRFSEGARQYLQETLGVDPTKERTTPQMLAGALGSVGSFLLPGTAAVKGASLLGRTAGTAARVGTATAASQGAALGAEQRSERIRQQLESGMAIPEETQLEAQRWSGIIGTLEAAPIKRFFEPLNVLLSKVPAAKAPIVEQIVKSRLGKITRAGIAEGAQEAASGIANDLMEYGVYNPNVKIGEDLLSNAGTGAFAGSVVESLIQLAAGRKAAPYRQLREDISREGAVSAQAQRQGEISRAAEELRQYNIEGDVEIIEEEFDGLPRFRIRTPAGNAVGDFLDAAEAEEALDIYKQRTDANVIVRKPADLPSVFPVKIGGKEYKTTDEAIADRDSLVAEAEGLAAYMARPDVIRREVARQNASEELVREATDQEVGELNNQITKLNEFLARAKPTPAADVGEADLRSQFAAPEQAEPAPIIEQEAPIGAVQPEDTVEAVATEPEVVVEPRPAATAEDLAAIQTDLFGAPKNTEEMTAEEEAIYNAERDRRFPPEETRPYSAAPLQGAPARRRTFAQAETEGPVIRELNQQTIDRYAKIYEELRNRLSGIVPKDADIKLTELIDSDKSVLIRGQARAEKTPNGIKSVVDLATGIMRPDMTVEQAVNELVDTLNHEIIHVLRTQGVIRPAEWRILSKAAANTRVPDRKYTYLDKAQAIYTPNGQPITPLYADPDAVAEEAVAEMYKNWVRNQKAPQQTRGLFNRITEFFRRIFRTLKSSQYEDIFGAIEAGDVGAREGVARESDARFSAAPALNSEEFRRWFRNSKIVDRNGKPLVVYHGSKKQFNEFKAKYGDGLIFFSTNPEFASKWPVGTGGKGELREPSKETMQIAKEARGYEDILNSELGVYDIPKDAPDWVQQYDAKRELVKQKMLERYAPFSSKYDIESRADIRMYPVYLSIQNPFDPRSDYRIIEPILQKMPKMKGVLEAGYHKSGNWVVYEDAEVIKALKGMGYDGILLAEEVGGPHETIAAFASEQVKSIFNEFEEGAATSPRFSAAPLPPYVEAKNRTLFVPEKQESVAQSIFNFFLGPSTEAKTLNTVYGQVDLDGGLFGTRANLYRRMSVVDQDAYVDFLEKIANEKETGNFQRREARQSAVAALGWARRRSQLTASTVMLGTPTIEFATTGDIQSATVAVREDADKLIDIFKVMLEPGPVDSVTGEQMDKRTIFKTYATAKRAIGLKAAGKPVPAELDDTYINTTIQFTQQNYPEIVEAYNSYQRFNKKLLTAVRDSGRITDAELARFTQQMDYYGFYRELYEEELVPGLPTKLAGEIKIREYRGSQRGELIEDPMVVIISNVDFWMGAMTRNIAVNKAFKLAKDMGEARLLGSSEKPDPSRGESEQVMFFRENGVLKRFAVKDPMLVASLGSDDRIDMGRMMGLLAAPTGFLRESITRDPAFMIANLVRDTLSSWITSGEDITPFIGTAAGAVKALKGSASYQALVGRGVVGSHDIAMRSPAEMAKIIRRRAMPSNIINVASIDGAQNMVASLWDKLGVLSEASDAATRIAVYEAAVKQGMSEAEAAFRSIEIMNFSRRGSNSLLRLFTQLIPFLNARIQGMDVLYQAGKAGWMTATGYQLGERDANLGKEFLVRGAILAVISVGLEMMLEDDEDYNDLPDYVKNGNILIPLKWFGVEGGYFAAIAKPFEAGLIFSTLPQEFYKATTGETSGREIAKLFWGEFTSTFGVNPIPQVALPALEALVNHDFYTDLPLISEGKARLAPELQYDSRTSTVAMLLGNIPIKYNFTTGKFEGISPIIIDQLISGYGGPFGTYIMQGAGMLMEGGDIGPDRLPRDVTQLPLVKRFLLDAESRSPKSVAQAYELFRVVDEANRSFSRLRQIGDAEAVMDYLEKNKDVMAYKKHIFKLVDSLNKISAYERRIEQDQTMTREEKVEAIKKLREVRARLTSNIGEINKALGR